MWLLSCESDLLEGKSIWLRPGTQHLLGRTTSKSSGEHVRYIDHKSISRKHLLIAIAPVETGDSQRVHVRSKITLTDASKSGTFINGKRLDRAEIVLEQSEAKIQLGTSSYVFQIKWFPVVLSFTNLTSTQKKQADPLESYRRQLEDADIKLVTTYLSSTTSHVVATNRNNPSCLQALAQGRWIVQYAWVDVLVNAVSLSSSQDEAQSLETDFFGTWPSERQCLVPAGNEPVQRPEEMLLPDDRRSELFSGLTFVFENEKQHDTLMPVVAACGGKCFLCEVTELQTQPASFFETVKMHFSTSRQAKLPGDNVLNKTAVVRWEAKDNLEWWDEFHNEVDKLIRRPSIQQKDFLDAILTVSINELCPIATSEDDLSSEQADMKPGDAVVIKTSPGSKASKLRRFAAAQPAFKGFSDFDPNQIAHAESSSASEAEIMDEDEPPVANAASRKRPAQSISDMIDQQLEGVNEVKRRRLDRASEAHPATDSDAVANAAAPKQKKSKVIDVKARLKEQRQREEEEARLNEEALHNNLDGLTVEDMKGFVQHAELEIDLSTHRQPQRTTRQNNRDWNPAWDDRPNFKAFKSQNHSGRQQRVMVTLEPVPVKRDLFSEDYFLEPSTQATSTRPHATASLHSNEVLTVLGDTPQEPDGIGRDSYGQDTYNTDISQSASTHRAKNKRPLAESSSGGIAPKKVKTRRAIDLDDDDDELSFRRKRM